MLVNPRLTPDFFDVLDRNFSEMKRFTENPKRFVPKVDIREVKDSYVLDPFLGSGTTLKWCKNNGYKGVGIELNDVYFNLCLENIGHNK